MPLPGQGTPTDPSLPPGKSEPEPIIPCEKKPEHEDAPQSDDL